jgi:membrane dipeptidase
MTFESTASSNDSSLHVQGTNHHYPHEASEGTSYAGHTFPHEPDVKTRGIVWGLLSIIFIAALVVLLCFQNLLQDSLYPWFGLLPGNATLAALAILDNAPVIVRVPHT